MKIEKHIENLKRASATLNLFCSSHDQDRNIVDLLFPICTELDETAEFLKTIIPQTTNLETGATEKIGV